MEASRIPPRVVGVEVALVLIEHHALERSQRPLGEAAGVVSFFPE